MPTQVQMKACEKKLKEYKKRFLSKKAKVSDEASTRLMINFFLTDVLGYEEFEEIRTEYRIAGEYADYVIQTERKKRFIVEVKSIQLDLSEKHLKQAVNYAANEGIDWVLLTNGKAFALHRVLFEKPISVKKVFEHDLGTEKSLKRASEDIVILSKKCVAKKDLEKYWERFTIVDPAGLSKIFYYRSVVQAIRKVMRQQSGINFSEEEVLAAIHEVVRKGIDTFRPTKPIEPRAKNVSKAKKQSLAPQPSPTSDTNSPVLPSPTESSVTD